MRIVCIILTLFWLVLLARILMSWFPAPRSGFARGLFEIVYDITEPVMRPIRGMLPPLRMGMVGLDLSPIIVFIALGILSRALGCRFGF